MTDDKIAAAVERLNVEGCNAMAAASGQELADVFVAGAKLRSIRANADAYSEAEYASDIAEAEANLDAALQRAAKKVLA